MLHKKVCVALYIAIYFLKRQGLQDDVVHMEIFK